ncbi:hypothetical protein [Alteribacter keqinensis]|uniref:Endolytic transglycosylase MltG n=1 Tax=Alteribacter keqinensis TaxID=2483800 RepID=A0A3M7TUL9_9BACI|nr:hypothetical protein [Alteribacter keqinensis]RNA68919.1 hypothetical protein EBO34_02860 [Alteribacter keqinensis]
MLSRNGLRGTAAGVFLTTTVFAGAFYFGDNESTAETFEDVTEEEALEVLESSGFVIKTLEEHNELVESEASLEARVRELEELKADAGNEEAADEEDTVGQDMVYQTALVVTSGMTFGDIAGILERTGIIDDRSEFNDYISNNNLEMALRQGEFIFDSSMTIPSIVSELTS